MAFIKDLREGQKKEREIAELLRAEYSDCCDDVVITLGPINKKNSDHDIKVEFTLNGEAKTFTYEVKADFMYEKTKNIAFEDCSKSKAGKMTFSGLYKSTADYWVVWTIAGVAIFNREDLIAELYLKRMSGDKKIVGKFCGDGWRAHNLIVNFAYALTFNSLFMYYPVDTYKKKLNPEKENLFVNGNNF